MQLILEKGVSKEVGNIKLGRLVANSCSYSPIIFLGIEEWCPDFPLIITNICIYAFDFTVGRVFIGKPNTGQF